MMVGVRKITDRLIDRLPPVRGTYIEDAPLGGMTWFRVGGAAETLFQPADADDLAAFLAARPKDIPVTMLGLGSNLLVRDGGVPGVVIHMGKPFAEITVEDGTIHAGAGAAGLKVANAAAAGGLAGLEFLAGIPGTVGGAIRMNAGAYGHEVSEVLIDADTISGMGRRERIPARALDFGYRHSALPPDSVVIGGTFHARRGDPAKIRARIAEIRAAREASQPLRTRTGGSTFKNPPGANAPKAWELIDAAGCRGLSRGGAMVSDLHCNFLINTGTATAADLEELGEEVRQRVRETSGIELDWEIRRVGLPGPSRQRGLKGGLT